MCLFEWRKYNDIPTKDIMYIKINIGDDICMLLYYIT